MSITREIKLGINFKLTFWGAVDDLVLLGCVLKNTLAAEHLFVVNTVKLNFFGSMSSTEFDATNVNGCCRLTLLVCLHWEAC